MASVLQNKVARVLQNKVACVLCSKVARVLQCNMACILQSKVACILQYKMSGVLQCGSVPVLRREIIFGMLGDLITILIYLSHISFSCHTIEYIYLINLRLMVQPHK